MLGMDTLAEFVDLYLLRCEVEGKSPNTVRAYRWTLERFMAILQQDDAPRRAESIEREHIYAYLGRFTELSADTRHRYFREVRCLFNWLVESGYLDQSPFRGVKNIRLPRRVVRPFSAEELGQLLAACGDEPVGARDRALVYTLLDTGLRCSEVVRLRQISGRDRKRQEGFPLSSALSRSELRGQRTPACEEESSLLGQRDVALTPTTNPEVLSQLIERRTESRR